MAKKTKIKQQEETKRKDRDGPPPAENMETQSEPSDHICVGPMLDKHRYEQRKLRGGGKESTSTSTN